MTETGRQMLMILALDPNAHLRFSTHTDSWYVSAEIEISDHIIISSVTRHDESPDGAVAEFFEAITNVGDSRVLVTHALSKRREWRWNGAAFAELPREEARAS
jgi:hypothetical protein